MGLFTPQALCTKPRPCSDMLDNSYVPPHVSDKRDFSPGLPHFDSTGAPGGDGCRCVDPDDPNPRLLFVVPPSSVIVFSCVTRTPVNISFMHAVSPVVLSVWCWRWLYETQHSKGHLDSKDPASVASFLRAQADRLDKTEVSYRSTWLTFTHA